MPRVEFGGPAATRTWTPNRQGFPCFLGSSPAMTPADLRGADVAIIGVPFVSSLVGQDNDLAPRNVRVAGLRYRTTHLPELGINVADRLRLVDYGDVLTPPGDIDGGLAAVERAVGDALDANCLPVTIGGNAPCSSYPVAKALVARGKTPLGLINLDCHTDAMPGDPKPNSSNWVRAMYQDIAGVRAESHIQIGMRGPNCPPDRVDFYRQRGIRIVWGPDAVRMGSERLASEAARHAVAGTAGIWLAIDYDVMDPAALTDWEEPDPLGLTALDVLTCAYQAGRTGKLAALSLMMINGQRESVHRLAVWTVLYALAGVAAARG